MYLEVSAMYLLELHRALEVERERGIRDGLRRARFLAEFESDDADSDGVAGVTLGDRAGGGGHAGTDLGRRQHLDPTPRPE